MGHQFAGYRQSRPIAVSAVHLPFVHGRQLRIPPWRQFRRLDQHRLQMRIPLLGKRSTLLGDEPSNPK